MTKTSATYKQYEDITSSSVVITSTTSHMANLICQAKTSAYKALRLTSVSNNGFIKISAKILYDITFPPHLQVFQNYIEQHFLQI